LIFKIEYGKNKKQLNKEERAVDKIAIYNLSERELGNEDKINEVARAVLGAILSIPRTGLKEKDIFFTFPRDFTRKSEKVSVVITGASFFNRKVNYQIRCILCLRVRSALQTVLRREAKDISVEIEPK